MIYLIANILLNTLISAILKMFGRFRIDALQALVINYCVCVITGSLFAGSFPINRNIVHYTWFPWAMLMGLGFITIFNLIAYCTRVEGITTTTIANKLSLVIPVLFSLVLYHDKAGVGKIAGILLAFPAVYMVTRVKGESDKPQSLLWPALLFVGSGLLDTLVKFVQFYYLPNDAAQQATYTTCCFAMAGTAGIILLIILMALKKITLHWRNVLAGICIGIPNYFSIYFLIRMLNSNFLQSSAAVPINNIGVLVASSLMAILLFREKASLPRVIGLCLSVAAILLIAFGDV